MQQLEGSCTPVLYIGRTVLKGQHRFYKINGRFVSIPSNGSNQGTSIRSNVWNVIVEMWGVLQKGVRFTSLW
jgi:hypothetical protein